MQTLVAYYQDLRNILPDLFILNSTSFFKAAVPIINQNRYKHLFLGNDATGDKLIQLALTDHSNYIDHKVSRL